MNTFAFPAHAAARDLQEQEFLDTPASVLRAAGLVSRVFPASLAARYRPSAVDMSALARLPHDVISARTGLSLEQVRAWYGR